MKIYHILTLDPTDFEHTRSIENKLSGSSLLGDPTERSERVLAAKKGMIYENLGADMATM